MTAVAMIHLDVLDADGQDVQGNVFVNEGSDSTLFRQVPPKTNIYLSVSSSSVDISVGCGDIVTVVAECDKFSAHGRLGLTEGEMEASSRPVDRSQWGKMIVGMSSPGVSLAAVIIRESFAATLSFRQMTT